MSDYSEMKRYIDERLLRGLDTPELEGVEVLALIDENDRLKREEKNDAIAYKAAIEKQKELRAEIKHLGELLECSQGDMRQADKIISERNRLLDAIPACPVHGQCVPHAIEWVEKVLLVMKELKAENEILRNITAELRQGANCRTVHHCKADQHEFDEPCKVLARIDSAISKGAADV